MALEIWIRSWMGRGKTFFQDVDKNFNTLSNICVFNLHVFGKIDFHIGYLFLYIWQLENNNFGWLDSPCVHWPATMTRKVALVSQPALFATEQLTVKFPEGNTPPVSDTSVPPSAWQLTLLPSASFVLTLGQITLTVVWFSGRQSFWSSGTVNVG